MAEKLTVVMDREKVDLEKLRGSDFLPKIVRNLNEGEPFVFLQGEEIVAQCVAKRDANYPTLFDVVNYNADSVEIFHEALVHVLDYYKENGGGYVDIGCGNAQVERYALFQRLGFRVIGVLQDYYIDDNKAATVENSIINRDMVRFRADLNEKTLATTGYDASGRT